MPKSHEMMIARHGKPPYNCAESTTITQLWTISQELRVVQPLLEAQMVSKIPSFTLSPGLQEELAAVTATGLYESPEAFLADAVRTLLAARPDLREAIACKLYEQGVFSLGRAAEWSGLSIEAMKDALHRWGIARQADEGPEATQAMAQEALQAARRTAL